MINSITPISSSDLMEAVQQMTQTEKAMSSGGIAQGESSDSAKAPGFGDMLAGLIKSVNDKGNAAQSQVQHMLSSQGSGGSDGNVHQAMLSIKEAGVAFSMMTEVRNQLVKGYQELMRMSV